MVASSIACLLVSPRSGPEGTPCGCCSLRDWTKTACGISTGAAAVLGLLVGDANGASAQVRTSDPMTTHGVSLEGEVHVGEARELHHPPCTTTAMGLTCPGPIVQGRVFGTLAVDVQDRVAQLGRAEESLFVELDASLRLGLRDYYRDDGAWRGAWLNVWVAAAIAHRTPSLTLRGSLGVAPPLRTLVTRGLPEAQLTAGWGQWDQWLAMERVVPVGVMGLVEGRVGQLDAGADTALVLGPTFSDDTALADRGLYFWGGLGGWLAAHLGDVVRLGLRAQGVFWLHSGPETRCEAGRPCATVTGLFTDFQASLVPFVRLLFPPGYLELRMQINLDEPHGPSLVGAEQVWAVALRGGASWDG